MSGTKSGSVGADLFVALTAIALGAFLLWGIADVSAGAGYDRIGPRFFPYIVATGMILLGASLVWSWRRDRQPPAAVIADLETRSTPTSVPLAYLALAFVLLPALLERTGYVIASSLQFWLVARAFQSRRPVRDAGVALAVAAIVYVAFSRTLGLSLPSGLVESLF